MKGWILPISSYSRQQQLVFLAFRRPLARWMRKGKTRTENQPINNQSIDPIMCWSESVLFCWNLRNSFSEIDNMDDYFVNARTGSCGINAYKSEHV